MSKFKCNSCNKETEAEEAPQCCDAAMAAVTEESTEATTEEATTEESTVEEAPKKEATTEEATASTEEKKEE